MSANVRGDAKRAGGRAHPGNHAEQVASQDEEENRPQERHELVGIVMADAGPGDVVAEVQQHRFEHVAEAAAWNRAAFECSGQSRRRRPAIKIATTSSITMNLVILKSSG